MAEKKSKRPREKPTRKTKGVTKVKATKPRSTAKAKTAAKRTRRKKSAKTMVKGDSQYPVYDPTASRDSYKVGDVVKFDKVRDWANQGETVEAYGKVVGIGIFDKTIPYLEVSFSDVKKLNSRDLGVDIRRFILEQK